MLTPRGIAVLVSPLPLALAGRVLAIIELYILAAGALALVGAAFFYVRLRSASLDARRSLHPPRVSAGTASRVDIEVTNRGRNTTPVIAINDPFDGGRRWARFLLAPIRRGEIDRAAYRVPTERRGVFDLGPLEAVLTDPFGMIRRRWELVGATQLTVYPRIDRIAPLPPTRGNDPHSGADHPTALSGQGEDFYALREYEIGDDTRRVHWPSTARTDELMIRQDEMPWQSRTTILLDVRRHIHTAESLELAVSAAASVHDTGRRQRSLTRLVTTAGVDSGFSSGNPHDAAVLEHLAAVTASRDDRFAGVTANLRKAAYGGALVVVTTADAGPADIEAVARLRARYGLVVLVVFERSAFDPSDAARQIPPLPVPRTATVVRVDKDHSFPTAWNTALSRRRLDARTPAR